MVKLIIPPISPRYNGGARVVEATQKDEAWTHLASSGGSNSQTSPEKTRTPGSTASLAGQAGSSLARTVKLMTASLTAVIFINVVDDDVDDDSNQWLLH